jgi:hypothetical protein
MRLFHHCRVLLLLLLLLLLHPCRVSSMRCVTSCCAPTQTVPRCSSAMMSR